MTVVTYYGIQQKKIKTLREKAFKYFCARLTCSLNETEEMQPGALV